jgi:hypothetical protein
MRAATKRTGRDYEYHTGDASLDVTAQEVRQLRREAD